MWKSRVLKQYGTFLMGLVKVDSKVKSRCRKKQGNSGDLMVSLLIVIFCKKIYMKHLSKMWVQLKTNKLQEYIKDRKIK